MQVRPLRSISQLTTHAQLLYQGISLPRLLRLQKHGRTVTLSDRDNHFFATIDFDNAMTVFRKVYSFNHLLYFPADLAQLEGSASNLPL